MQLWLGSPFATPVGVAPVVRWEIVAGRDEIAMAPENSSLDTPVPLAVKLAVTARLPSMLTDYGLPPPERLPDQPAKPKPL